jgi:hypothetical protein
MPTSETLAEPVVAKRYGNFVAKEAASPDSAHARSQTAGNNNTHHSERSVPQLGTAKSSVFASF